MVPKRQYQRRGDLSLTQLMRLKRSCWILIVSGIIVGIFAVSCQMVPTKPEAVFNLYRNRMKSQNLAEARALLSPESKKLIDEITHAFSLNQAPEQLALLNALDPVSEPILMKMEDTTAILQVRTLKGGLRLIRLLRKDSNSPWAIDLSEELKTLESFLKAQHALEMMRDQAGEFAASWKAFNEQLNKLKDAEPQQQKQVIQKPAPISKPKQKSNSSAKGKK